MHGDVAHCRYNVHDIVVVVGGGAPAPLGYLWHSKAATCLRHSATFTIIRMLNIGRIQIQEEHPHVYVLIRISRMH